MARITFIQPNGTENAVEAEPGMTVMEAAVKNSVRGIAAECGGACACATCHSYVDEAWLDKMPPMDDMEDSMLDAAFERRDNSRLTCQIEVNNDLDGLIIHVAFVSGVRDWRCVKPTIFAAFGLYHRLYRT